VRWLRTTMLVLGLAVAGTAAAHAQGFPSPSTSLDDEAIVLVDGYAPWFAQKRVMKRRYGAAYDELHKAIVDRQMRGEMPACSSQILTEVSWLIQYTNDTSRIEKRLEDLRRSMDYTPAQQHAAREQSPEDGSWGGCFEEWFLRVHASADPAKLLAVRGQRPVHKFKFLDRVGSGPQIAEYLRSRLVSRAGEDGRNQRKELNLVVAGLGQLLFLPELAYQFDRSSNRNALAQALKDFMDREWQDPTTGYWGSWYDIDGKVMKTEDLSITFHIASYRNGRISRIREMVRTTLRIRDRRYPLGWHDRGTQNNHHAYDVVRLLRLGWPYMTDEEKANAWAEIVIILARARRLSMNVLGQFDSSPYSSLDEAYYFGVSLLDELGYFRPSRRFWIFTHMWKPDDSEELRRKILANIERLGVQTPMMAAARQKLLLRD
jgi:hypothetical protein